MVDNSQYRLLTSYAINTSVSRFRARGISSDQLELRTCQALVEGCGRTIDGTTDVGQDIFQEFVGNATGLDSLGGFGEFSLFAGIEGAVRTGYLSSYSSGIQDKYSTISAGVLLGGYAADLDVANLETYFSRTFKALSGYYGGPSDGFFSKAQLTTLQTNLNLGDTLTEIFALSPKNTETSKIYFQTYDLTKSFTTTVDPHRFKDAGMQCYSVSGDLTYEGTYWDDTPDCNEIEIPVFLNSDVEMVSQYYSVGPSAFPCIDRHSTIRPLTGVEFERKFVDGPYSTGEWSQGIVADEYISREKLITPLQAYHYESNRKAPDLFEALERNEDDDNDDDDDDSPLPSISSTVRFMSVVLDLPDGEYKEPFRKEEKSSPANGQTTWFHVGNATGVRIGREIDHYIRNPLNNYEIIEKYRDNPKASTGVKFVPLRLKQSVWKETLNDTACNPFLESGRIFQTAMNFHSGHSIDIHSSRPEGGLSGIAGPPQRDDLSDLPYFTITQDFQSKTNNTYPSIILGYGMSNSERNGPTNGSYHHQTFMTYTSGSGAFLQKFEEDENFWTPDEATQPKVLFDYSIFSTELSNLQLDGQSIRAHVMGFGNSLDGGKAESTYKIKNGGYIHSGRFHSGVGVPTGAPSVLDNLVLISGYSGTPDSRIASGFGPIQDPYQNIPANPIYGSVVSKGCVVGATEYYDEYIHAWKHPDYGTVSTSLMYMYYEGVTGLEEYRYSGFDDGRTQVDVPQFPPMSPLKFAQGGSAKIISGLVGSGWVPLKKRQRRENFFPRYVRGAYASARRKFLYKHAHDMVTGFTEFGTIDAKLTGMVNQGPIDFHDWSGAKIPIVQYNSGGFSQRVGFPHLIVFDLEVKEYATKEFYKKTDWNRFGNRAPGNYSLYGVDPSLKEITWTKHSRKDVFSPTDSVDANFAGPRVVQTYANGLYSDIFMGFTGVNPLVYNSPPNFVQGFINDREGDLSGSLGWRIGVGQADWPNELKPDSGAFIVRWKDGISGSSLGDWKYKSPEGNYTLYKSHKRRLTGIYTPPGFRLHDSHFHPEFAQRIWGTGLLGAIEGVEYGETEDSDIRRRKKGVDPLYYKRVGSAVGLEGITLSDEDHGGYHPDGLHGDSWMVFSPSGYILGGTGDEAYYEGGVGKKIYGYGRGNVDKDRGHRRVPKKDYGIIMLDMRSTGFGFHFRGLDYFPNSGRQSSLEVVDKKDFFKSGIYTGYGEEGKFINFDFVDRTYTYLGKFETGMLFAKPVDSSGSPWPGWKGTPAGYLGKDTSWPDIKEFQKEHTGSWRNWRSQSKIELTFTNVIFTGHGQLPIDEEYLYEPSGGCRIEGQMNYVHMAESPVFSEGIILEDTSPDDPVLTRGNYSNFISDVLKEHSVSPTVPLNALLQPAPSRKMTLTNPHDDIIISPSDLSFVDTIEKDYNKYIVFAKSDYATLNAGVMPSYEGRPVADDRVFPRADMMFSANKGQPFQDGTSNPSVRKQYTVKDQRQYYEGELTDAVVDPRFTTHLITKDLYLDEDNGQFIPSNVTLREGERGLY